MKIIFPPTFLNIFIIRCQLKRHFKFEWKWHDNLIWIFSHNFDLIEQNLTIHVQHMSTYLTVEASIWIVTEFYDTKELVVMSTRVRRQVKTIELFNYERNFMDKIQFFLKTFTISLVLHISSNISFLLYLMFIENLYKVFACF